MQQFHVSSSISSRNKAGVTPQAFTMDFPVKPASNTSLESKPRQGKEWDGSSIFQVQGGGGVLVFPRRLGSRRLGRASPAGLKLGREKFPPRPQSHLDAKLMSMGAGGRFCLRDPHARHGRASESTRAKAGGETVDGQQIRWAKKASGMA